MVFSTGLFVGIFVGILLGAAIVYTSVALGQRDQTAAAEVEEALDYGEEIGTLPVMPKKVTEFPVRRYMPGESSGPRHALPDDLVLADDPEPGWPDGDPDATQRMASVQDEVNA